MFEVISVMGTVLFAAIFISSVILNVYLVKKLLFFNENLNVINTAINNFVTHLETVYQMQMYYGDETLKNMIEHSKDLHSTLVQFRDSYESETKEGEISPQ